MIVTPYGDPNAHGTIGKTLTFIRRRGGVYARPYKIPKDPRSAGQLAQRQLFIDAKNGWFALSSQSRDFWNQRAQGQLYTGYNLYLSAFMTGTLPSETPFQLLDVEACTIGYLRGSNFNSWKISLDPDPTGMSWGWVWDNQNTFNDGAVQAPARTVTVDVTRVSENIAVQFRDTVTIDYDGAQQLIIFMPDLTANTTLWVAQDGSTYWDSIYTQLACAAYP